MKKFSLFLSCFILLASTLSCVKPSQLVGTNWLSFDTAVTFTSTTSCDLKEINGVGSTPATYTIQGGKITISADGDSVTGKISGKEMKFDVAGGSVLGGLSSLGGMMGGKDVSDVRKYLSGRTFKKQ